jgi:hypothetical protein
MFSKASIGADKKKDGPLGDMLVKHIHSSIRCWTKGMSGAKTGHDCYGLPGARHDTTPTLPGLPATKTV